MPRLYYDAVDRLGRPTPGTLDCEGEERLGRILEEKGLTLVRASLEPLHGPHAARRRLRRGRVGADERALYAAQVARLLQAGCPLDRAQRLVAESLSSRRMARAVEEIERDVTQGTSFARAVEAHPDVFGTVFIAAARAGEAGGFLATALSRLAAFELRQSRLRRRVLQSLAYPAFLALAMLGCLGVLLGFVVPTLLAYLAEAHLELPAATRVLIAASGHAPALSLSALALVILALAARAAWLRLPEGRLLEDRLLLKLPLAGWINRTFSLGVFCRTLSLLLGSGVPLPRALEIVQGVLQNGVFRHEVARAAENVLAGESLSRCLEVSAYFPRLLVGQLHFGEETGNVEKVLESLADEYETAHETALETLVGLAEPAMIVGMGLLMAGIVLAIFQPLTQMVNVP